MTEQELAAKYLGWTEEMYNAYKKSRKNDKTYDEGMRKILSEMGNDPEVSASETNDFMKSQGAHVTTGRSWLNKLTDGIGLTNVADQIQAKTDAEIALNDAKDSANETYGDIAEAMGGSDSITAFRDAVNDFDPSAYGVDLSKLTDYNYGKTVADFMDPAAEYRINKSVEATQNAMAGQGGLSGGAAARQLQAVASEAASDEYNNAYERLLKDQELDYGKTKDLISAEQANSNLGLNAANAKLSNLGTVNDNYVNALLAAMQSDANLSTALAQLGIDSANAQSAFGQILGAVKDGSQIYANLSA